MEKINYHGWPDSIRLSNDTVELVALTHVGPRIIYFGFREGDNVLAEDPELSGQVGPVDKWVNYGGHRLWVAPEVAPRTYAPDNNPVKVATEGETVVLTSDPEPLSGVQKQLRVTLASGDIAAVKVEHRITNVSDKDQELAAWGLTVVTGRGRVILPQEPYAAHGDEGIFLPSRPVVLWPYTDMSDPRWTFGRHYIQLRSNQAADSPQKGGVFNSLGWGAFVDDGDLLVIFIQPDPRGSSAYCDFGSNFETYTKGDFQELETLGPMVVLKPGETTDLTEYWSLIKAPTLPEGDEPLSQVLGRFIGQARARTHGW